jgi:multiple sugar transport system permease protein
MRRTEAARIDGANHAQIYLGVVLPLSAPALGALAIFTFVAQWNNFLWPLITTSKPEMQVPPLLSRRCRVSSTQTGRC